MIKIIIKNKWTIISWILGGVCGILLAKYVLEPILF